ncbi:MAG TPA: hypothetical protein DCE41_10030, partial [Cytophagales bacterium]|nr:hypothetical protein [Cytophagales bacterium]
AGLHRWLALGRPLALTVAQLFRLPNEPGPDPLRGSRWVYSTHGNSGDHQPNVAQCDQKSGGKPPL